MSINPADLAAAAEGILNHQYLQQRERLLSASAQASRLLLESPDAMKAMPEVLRLLGEAAQVDRTALAFAEIGPNGEKWLKIKAEWISDTVQCPCDGEEDDGTWTEPPRRPVLLDAHDRQERGVLSRRNEGLRRRQHHQ